LNGFERIPTAAKLYSIAFVGKPKVAI